MGRTGKNYEYEGCDIIKSVTPYRMNHQNIYLCRCKRCGRLFVRSRKWLSAGHDDCGCSDGTSISRQRTYDYELRHMDELSKNIIKMKIDALGDINLSYTFEVLYIRGCKFNEYVAIQNYMSKSTMYRNRKKILTLYPALVNDLMKKGKNENVHS